MLEGLWVFARRQGSHTCLRIRSELLCQGKFSRYIKLNHGIQLCFDL